MHHTAFKLNKTMFSMFSVSLQNETKVTTLAVAARKVKNATSDHVPNRVHVSSDVILQ